MEREKYPHRLGGHGVVFGGSGGIGRAVVEALATRGVRNISYTYGRNKAEADALSAALNKMGVKHYYASLNPADDIAVQAFLDAAVKAIGAEIEHAVNAVGWSPDTPFQEQTAELWMKVYEINAVGTFISTRAVANRMVEQGIKGSIVLITSSNAYNSWSPFSAPYDSSKGAVAHTMVPTFAFQYKEYGIRVNAVAPGWVATKMNDTVPKEDMQKELQAIWMKRQATPAEIADIIVFQLSDGTSFVTGQNWIPDGGYGRL